MFVQAPWINVGFHGLPPFDKHETIPWRDVGGHSAAENRPCPGSSQESRRSQGFPTRGHNARSPANDVSLPAHRLPPIAVVRLLFGWRLLRVRGPCSTARYPEAVSVARFAACVCAACRGKR